MACNQKAPIPSTDKAHRHYFYELILLMIYAPRQEGRGGEVCDQCLVESSLVRGRCTVSSAVHPLPPPETYVIQHR